MEAIWYVEAIKALLTYGSRCKHVASGSLTHQKRTGLTYFRSTTQHVDDATLGVFRTIRAPGKLYFNFL